MSSKHSHAQHSAVPEGADDFKLIHGIGPGIAQRLHDAGILSFAQLAALSSDEIAALLGGIAGLSSKNIATQDWIGQAHALATDTIAAVGRQHYATFTVELLLDEENTVRRTHVTHVQAGVADTWARWEAERLLEFFTQQAGLHLAAVEQVTVTVPKAEVSQGVISARSILHLSALEPIPQGADGPRQFLSHGQPYALRLTLSFDDEALVEATPLQYRTAIYAKSLEGQSRQAAGEANGTLTSTGRVCIDVAGTLLPRGIYRLEAAVSVTLPGGTQAPEVLTAFLEGGLLQVY